MAGTFTRCRSYKGVRLIEVSFGRELTVSINYVHVSSTYKCIINYDDDDGDDENSDDY